MQNTKNDLSDNNENPEENEDFYTRTQRLSTDKWTDEYDKKVECAYDGEKSFFDELEPVTFGKQNSNRTRGGGRGQRGQRGQRGNRGRKRNEAFEQI